MKWEKVKQMAKPYVPNAERFDVRQCDILIRKCPSNVFPVWMYNNICADYDEHGDWVIKTRKRRY